MTEYYSLSERSESKGTRYKKEALIKGDLKLLEKL